MSRRELPRVSVVMNVRNGEAYVGIAIESVLAQDVDDWEVVVLDDCSTDESARIISEYGDSRIRYHLASRDVPLGPARSEALKHARAPWVAFLDQDDIWLPDKLRRQLALAEGPANDAVGLVYGRTVAFDAAGRQRDFDHRHEYVSLPEGEIFQHLFRDSCFICMSSAMFRKSAIEAVGGISPWVQIVPDYQLFLAIAHRYQARAVQDIVCRYRLHGGNMTAIVQRQMHEEALRLLDEWASELDPALLEHRRRVHQTIIGFERMLHPRTFVAGIGHVLKHGSATFLLSRPFARAWRAARRRLVTPTWQEGAGHA